MKILFIIIILISILTSCSSYMSVYQNEKFVKYPCDLNNHINDTIFVSGVYSSCMEYSSFDLMEKDNCSNDFNICIDFDADYPDDINKTLDKRFDKIQGCGVYMKLVLKGILKNDNKNGYGHLGSNNAKLEVIEFIKIGKVKTYKAIDDKQHE